MKCQQSWGLCYEHTFSSYYMSNSEVAISQALQRLNLLAVISSRGYDCCGLLGVPEILEGTEKKVKSTQLFLLPVVVSSRKTHASSKSFQKKVLFCRNFP